MSNNSTYEAIERLLATDGVAILHRTQVPMNPVNLFEMLVSQGRRVTVEVDDAFIEEMRGLAQGSEGE